MRYATISLSVIGLLGVLLAGTILADSRADADEAYMTVTIGAGKESFQRGEPIPLAIDVHDISGNDAWLWDSPGRAEDFDKIVVVREDGTKVPLTDYGKEIYGPHPFGYAGSDMAPAILNPGDDYVQRSDMSRLYDMSRAGAYSVFVWVTLDLDRKTLSKSKRFRSNVLTILVKP